MTDVFTSLRCAHIRAIRVIRVPYDLMNTISSAKTRIIKNTIKTILKTCHAKSSQKNLMITK
jgi:hypothetical protein